MFSSSLLLLSIGKLDLPTPNSPPPEFIGAAASRIYHGAQARQPDLIAASRESDGGAAQGSNLKPLSGCLLIEGRAFLFHVQ